MTKKVEVKNDFERDAVKVDFANLAGLIIKDLNQSQSTNVTRYTKENVATYLNSPIQYSKNLQGMSAFLYDASPHYRRLINYYAKMPTLDYFVEPYGLDTSKSVNVKSLRSNYMKAIDSVEMMNIKYEYGKALVTAWKLGTFYGYEIFAKDSYFIMELPYEFCQISGIYDGVMTFSFDMTYFDKNPNQLNMYPKEIVSMYKKYQSGSQPKWQEIDPKKSVCIKINPDIYHDMPPFVGIFADIFDIEDYKKLRKISEIIGNYKFIIEKIPLRDKSEKNNDFLVDLKTVKMFHNKTAGLLPDEIGIFSTPFEIDTVEFKKDTTNKDTVEEAERGFYSASGTNQMLFNSPKSSQSGLKSSINVDESEIFLILRQIERILSTKSKEIVKGAYKFKVTILNNTIFNRKENTEMLLQNAQYGLPVKLMLCASLGLNPSAVTSLSYLENVVLGLSELFIPLQSSHTQSSSDEGGRPVQEEVEEKGEEQRQREDNENRV